MGLNSHVQEMKKLAVYFPDKNEAADRFPDCSEVSN
jgi:hypothetical protein